MKRLFGRFRHLQWKLTATYTCFTSIVALLALVGLFAMIWGAFTSPVTLSLLGRVIASDISDQIAPLISDESRHDELQAWLTERLDLSRIEFDSNTNNDVVFEPGTTALDSAWIVNRQSVIVADTEPGNIGSDIADDNHAAIVSDLISGKEDSFLYPLDRQSNGRDTLFIPISQQGQVEGVAVLGIDNPLNRSGAFATVVSVLLVPLSIPVLLLATLIGLPFGFLATRGLSRRLRNLATSADSWAAGDFSVVVDDKSGDEIGQLGRQLNSMATELDTLIHSRSQLATVEERNRIARDLHDSAKQQIFATTMQLSAARSLMDTNPEQAKLHMSEAEQLAKAVQKELSGLIEELRPAQLEGTGLYGAVRSAVTTFKRQSGISAEVRTQGERELPIMVEQPLFRILQESLNNISKHSQAKNVDVHLVATPDAITMTIHDDGVGFSQDDAAKGGLGLRSMQERIAQLNGSLRVTSNPEKGTTVRAECPITA